MTCVERDGRNLVMTGLGQNRRTLLRVSWDAGDAIVCAREMIARSCGWKSPRCADHILLDELEAAFCVRENCWKLHKDVRIMARTVAPRTQPTNQSQLFLANSRFFFNKLLVFHKTWQVHFALCAHVNVLSRKKPLAVNCSFLTAPSWFASKNGNFTPH